MNYFSALYRLGIVLLVLQTGIGKLAAGLPQGTKVKTVQGLKCVEYLKPGDKIISYDNKQKKCTSVTIKDIFTRKAQQVVTLVTSKGSMLVAADHKLYDARLKRFKQAKEFAVGDRLISKKGLNCVCSKLIVHHKTALCYEVVLDGAYDIHWFFAGDAEVLTHNFDFVPFTRQVIKFFQRTSGLIVPIILGICGGFFIIITHGILTARSTHENGFPASISDAIKISNKAWWKEVAGEDDEEEHE